MDDFQKYNRALSNLRQEVGKLKTALFNNAKVIKQLEQDKTKLSQENNLLKKKVSTFEKELQSKKESKEEIKTDLDDSSEMKLRRKK